uniref:Uncharacterized protein n=1 Tax=Anguilla anguilla TaxID=7936 RepID=A0A0E9WJZ5_ANGAN
MQQKLGQFVVMIKQITILMPTQFEMATLLPAQNKFAEHLLKMDCTSHGIVEFMDIPSLIYLCKSIGR